MRTIWYPCVGALALLLMPAARLFAQVSTNEGGYDVDGELRDLNERIQTLEAQQAERVERELSSLRAQLREARRLEQSRLAQARAAKKDDRPSKTMTERTASDPSRRYQYYQGRWWHWRSSNSWAVYDKDRWVPYPPRTAGRQ